MRVYILWHFPQNITRIPSKLSPAEVFSWHTGKCTYRSIKKNVTFNLNINMSSEWMKELKIFNGNLKKMKNE